MRKLIFAGILTLGGLLTINAQCKTVTAITENFDAWKDIDNAGQFKKEKQCCTLVRKKSFSTL